MSTEFAIIPSPFNNLPEDHPIVFISYSWDSENHKAWVRKLSDDLRTKYSVHTLLDQYNRGGYSLIAFMTTAIEKADRVLLIGTPEYKRKSERYEGGGAKYEDQLISVELYHKMGSSKFIPVLREGKFDTAFTRLIEVRNGYDMVDDADYEDVLRTLAADLWNNPLNAAPSLGPKPIFVKDYGSSKEAVVEVEELSLERFVAEIKHQLSTPNSTITITEMIERETEIVYDRILQKADYNFSINPQLFKEYREYHLKAVEKLIAASIIIVRHGSLKQQELLSNALVKLCMKPFRNGEVTVVGTSNLHLFAASFLFHAIGITCVKYGYYQILPVIMKTRVPAGHVLSPSHSYSLAHLAGTNHWSWEVLNNYMDSSWYYPYSELISRNLHPYFKRCFLNDEEYKDCYAAWEFLFSLMYVYYKCALFPGMEGYPVGLFLSERYFRQSLLGGDDLFSQFLTAAQKEKNDWEPIKQGLFDGNYSEYEGVCKAAKDFFKNHRRF